MESSGVSWAPFAAAVAAVPLLGVGAAPWLAAPAAAAMMALAATVVARWTTRKRLHPAEASELAGLQRALRRRDEQLASTVHELRTPLASVITALELLRSGRPDGDGEAAELADIATLAARHLSFLVDDVLDEQALANGGLRLSLGSHRVRHLFPEASRALELQAVQHGITLRFANVDEALAVRADARRFLQVLFNLVGNAMKFTPRGGHVDVRAEGNRNRVRFEVEDDGPGIPPALENRLFVRLAGDDGGTRGGSGSGLGLYVSARIVQQMGGRIGHEKPPAGGSRFWFELPLAHPRPITNSEIAQATGGTR